MPWQPVPGNIMTRWAQDVSPDNPWPEYPRPQMRRPDWQNLNGLWEFEITPRGAKSPGLAAPTTSAAGLRGQILVPFPIESALSGVKRRLGPEDWLWYRRMFSIPEAWRGKRVLLHFGAVDWEMVVWLNGREAGRHVGGYLPFWFDVTDALREGENEIVVRVWDPTDAHWQQRGKQVLKPKSIWYTAVSGIWQTVWLEPVPQAYIAGLKVTPDVEAGEVRVKVRLDGQGTGAGGVTVRVLEAGVEVAAGGAEDASAEIRVPIPNPKLWSPDSPHLYGLEVSTGADRVESYFGMRRFSVDGGRLCLNGAPLFQFGPLDQGYWPDGLYTPPTDEAMRADIELVKRLGFNMLRKHVKVEPARYYWYCDQMGLVVWQDMPNGGQAVGDVTSFLAILFGSRRRDSNYRYAGRAEEASRRDFRRELQEMVDALYNFPCIGMWVPFNEGWGQFDAKEAADWLKAYDPSRPVDHASGWFDQGGGDCKSLHVYFKKLKPELLVGEYLNAKGTEVHKGQEHKGKKLIHSFEKLRGLRVGPFPRAAVLSEFGGYSLKVDGHLWNPAAVFGYKKFATRQALTEAYLALLEDELTPCVQAGLSAAVYTQTTDVEIEVNGYVTYDRAAEKMDFEKVREAHARLFEAARRREM